MGKRGRPPNAANVHLVAEDELIARTVAQLVLWGFPLRSRVLPAVERSLRKFPTERCAPIRQVRIEEIYEAWRDRQEHRFRRAYYEKRSLCNLLPDKTKALPQLIELLLSNGGSWPEVRDNKYFPPDLNLTPKGAALLRSSRLVRRG